MAPLARASYATGRGPHRKHKRQTAAPKPAVNCRPKAAGVAATVSVPSQKQPRVQKISRHPHPFTRGRRVQKLKATVQLSRTGRGLLHAHRIEYWYGPRVSHIIYSTHTKLTRSGLSAVKIRKPTLAIYNHRCRYHLCWCSNTPISFPLPCRQRTPTTCITIMHVAQRPKELIQAGASTVPLIKVGRLKRSMIDTASCCNALFECTGVHFSVCNPLPPTSFICRS